MSEKPLITFTAEEQKTLTSIANNERLLKNLHALLQKGQFPGADVAALIESFGVVENLLGQVVAQKNEVQKKAENRVAQEAAVEAESKTEKAAGNA